MKWTECQHGNSRVLEIGSDEARLRVTPLGGWARMELIFQWSGSVSALAWQMIDGQWQELSITTERREGQAQQECALEISNQSELLGELLAAGPLELSWGRRPGKYRLSISPRSNFPVHWDNLIRQGGSR